MSDFSVVESQQSTTANIPANTSFVGPWEDVTQYTSITTMASANVPPAVNNAIQYEWSSDGINVDSVMTFGSDASTQQVVHSAVRGQYFRLRYTAGGVALTGVRVQTLLRNGPINASVSRIGLITGSPDAQNTNAVVMGKTAGGVYQATRVFPDVVTPTDFLLGVDQPAKRTNALQITTNANLASVQIDFAGIAAVSRRWMEVYNDTIRGNLFIRLGSAVTLVNYHYKIPPQHRFVLPLSWPMYGGTGATVFGIWDTADGAAHSIEGF